MLELAPLIGLIFAAAITPGPNNVIVLRAGSAGGLKSAFMPISGILLGSALLYAFASLGLEHMLAIFPNARSVIAVAGAAYLSWLGSKLVFVAPDSAVQPSPLPTGAVRLMLFQFANPKAWILVTAIIAGRQHIDLFLIATIFLIIGLVCLSLWATIGVAMNRLSPDGKSRRRIDIICGLTLTGFAAWLLLNEVLQVV